MATFVQFFLYGLGFAFGVLLVWVMYGIAKAMFVVMVESVRPKIEKWQSEQKTLERRAKHNVRAAAIRAKRAQDEQSNSN